MSREQRVLTVTRQEIQNCWLGGWKLEEILPLCPQSEVVKQFVTNEFVRLEMTMKSSRINYNAHVISRNSHGNLSS